MSSQYVVSVSHVNIASRSRCREFEEYKNVKYKDRFMTPVWPETMVHTHGTLPAGVSRA